MNTKGALRRPMLHEHQRCPKENFVQFAHLTLTLTLTLALTLDLALTLG